MGSPNIRQEARLKRKKRIRKKIFGTPERPRLSVFRTSRHIYAQIIDDTNGSTLVAAGTCGKAFEQEGPFENKVSVARHIGKVIARKAQEKGIRKVVFDRNGFLYHGRVKAVSDGAREGGLEF